MAITIKQQPEELSASGNRMYFLVHTDRTNTINYKMTAQIQLIESANKVVELPLMRLYPNADGDVDMDISKIIDNRLRPEFPGLETNEYCKLKGFTLQYKVVFTEEGNYIPINSTTTDILTAVKGKFPASPSEFIRKNDFLTNFQAFETVADGVHFLVALILNPGSYTINSSFSYTDGTTRTTSFGRITTTSQYEMYAIPTGLQQLKLSGVKKYSFWLSGETMCEKRMTYDVVRIVKAHKPILYLNRLGGIDCIIVSEISNSIKTDKETYQRDNSYAQGIITDYSEIFEVTTGYITRDMAFLSKEFILSDSVYTSENNVLLPINIEKGTFNIYADADDLHFYTFKYSFANLNFHLLSSGTPEPLPESVMACCPDGVDDYFTITSPTLTNMMNIFPCDPGQKIVYSMDMIPRNGSMFSLGLMAGIYLEFFYSGLIFGIICLCKSKKYMFYQESSSVNIDKRVKVELSVSNNNNTLEFGLKINSLPETLTLSEAEITNTTNFMYLFKKTNNVPYGDSKLISFSIDKIISETKTNLILWDFNGESSTERLKNKIENGTAYDLMANNIANIDDIIKPLKI